MKQLTIIALLFLTPLVSLAGNDIIYLKDGTKVKGKITKVIPNESITYTKKKVTYTLLPDQIDHVMVRNLKRLQVLQRDMYSDGYDAAEIQHKGRYAGNFCAGFFGGIIGFVIVAVTDAKRPSSLSNEEDQLASREFKDGYNKKAKKMNLGAAGIGWAIGFVLLLLVAN